MKHIPPRIPIYRRSVMLFRLICFALAMLVWGKPYAKAAQIEANFTDGNTTSLVDGYAGMAGNGWTGPWVATKSGSCEFANSVASASPLEGGGNYLGIALNVTGTAAGTYMGSIGRKFDPTVVSNSNAYTISFKVRLDTAMTNAHDKLNIIGDIGSGYIWSTGANNTFLISGVYDTPTPMWTVCDGDRAGSSTSVSTGMPLIQGVVYNFLINVDPVTRSWTVAIDNGTYIYQSGVLGFRNAAYDGGKTINFGATVDKTTGALRYSVDNLGISSGGGSFPGSSLKLTEVALNTQWRFATDPSGVGQTNGWYTEAFNDSAWQNIKSGASWESQGVNYSGFAWYRQKIVIPAGCQGVPIRLMLASIDSDDEVYFNGVRVGGISGGYKYDNLLNREYSIPVSLIRYGEMNTVAIRIWGGNLGFDGKNSGLIAGDYIAELDPFRIMARETGGQIDSEQPIELFDMSVGQQGVPFQIVFRYPQTLLGGSAANLTYTLKYLYGGSSIATATVPVTVATDGIARGVASITGTQAQDIYFAGQIQAVLTLKNTAGTVLSTGTTIVTHLCYAERDAMQLPELSGTVYENTPYGSLKLVDTINCATAIASETHPYMQSGPDPTHKVDCNSPGVKISIPVNTILGKQAREPGNGWFAYRIGRGKLTPGATYLLRIEYPEDKPRYCPVEVQSGNNYMDIGWKNGISSTDVYDNWPLSGTWQYYDVIVSVAENTTGAGGAGAGDAQNGFWVYFLNKMKPGYYFKLYSGGPAVASMRLYEISPTANAPAITVPQGLPQRTMTFDWERQPEQVPADLVSYAKLMGYSAISPVILKWALDNYGDPLSGYDHENIDDAGYWVNSPYTLGSHTAPTPAVAGMPSVHKQYLDATKAMGVDYIPRFEYGGSLDLPSSAHAIDKTGEEAKPNRFSPAWGANLLNASTYTDLKAFLDSLFLPYADTNPQLKGALWRIREDRMQISYGRNDVALFCSETGIALPSGYTDAQLAVWASGTMGTTYSAWWQGKRADFHRKVKDLLKSYRSDMSFYYYNWDQDKWSMMQPDINASWFYHAFSSTSAATNAYATDRANRATYTAQDYINLIATGDFTNTFIAGNGTAGPNLPHYALHPDLYTSSSSAGIQLFAPVNYLCYANQPDYLNYFQTADGLAVSNCVSYDEIGSRWLNPKFECNMMLPGGGAFSMAMELLSYFHGDARTLTYTVYTYGRGFADAHRRFAQAFRALPAVPGTVVTGTDPDVKVRTYDTVNGTYVGVAHKGYAGKTITVTVPGLAGKTVKNLVTGAVVAASASGSDLTFALESGPMELNAFLVTGVPAPVITSAVTASATVGTAVSYQITATGNPTSFSATGLPSGLSVNASTGLIGGTPTASGTSIVTISASNGGGTGTATLVLTVNAVSSGIFADFTAGNSITAVDGYAGMAGNGWLGAWVATKSGSCAYSNSVTSTSPMSGGGNYLGVSLGVTGTAAGAYNGAVGRKFDSSVVSPAAAHTISYKVRLDTALANGSDSILIFGDVGTGYAWGTSSNNTWLISGGYSNGSSFWYVYNGDGAGSSTKVATSMALTVGTVYTVTIQVDPVAKTWMANINDGTTSYQSGSLGFRNAAASGAGNSLYFGTSVRNTTGALGYSVDTVKITAP